MANHQAPDCARFLGVVLIVSERADRHRCFDEACRIAEVGQCNRSRAHQRAVARAPAVLFVDLAGGLNHRSSGRRLDRPHEHRAGLDADVCRTGGVRCEPSGDPVQCRRRPKVETITGGDHRDGYRPDGRRSTRLERSRRGPRPSSRAGDPKQGT